ncbi:MAG: hypothetical protein IID33_14265, partial [Planctomycetes bacterium]|nr:hypothetical protein [Planctomycetota bacterium]
MAATGCGLGMLPVGSILDGVIAEPSGLAAEVAAKALATSERIGGADGFGGAHLDDYSDHIDRHMGFHGAEYLADPDGRVVMRFENASEEEAVFQVVYLASHLGMDERIMEVSVAAASSATVDLPCAEIVGLGSLTDVGDIAARLAGGAELDNQWREP